MKEIRKIVSHLSPRHLDDYLSVAVLKALYPKAIIEYVHPQEVPTEYYHNEEIALVDVGEDFDPVKNNYDHHQDKEIACSLILVLNALGLYQKTSAFLNAIDIIDRFGFTTAKQRGLVISNNGINDKRKIILLTEINNETAQIVFETLKEGMEKNLDYNQFINLLYERLSSTPAFIKAIKTLEEEEKAYQEKKKKITFFIQENIVIAFSSKSFSPQHTRLFAETNADFLIETNSINPNHTSLVINANSSKKKKVYALREAIIRKFKKPVVFKHPNNFIVVIDVPFNEVVKNIHNIKIEYVKPNKMKPNKKAR